MSSTPDDPKDDSPDDGWDDTVPTRAKGMTEPLPPPPLPGRRSAERVVETPPPETRTPPPELRAPEPRQAPPGWGGSPHEVLERRKKQEMISIAIGGALMLALFVYACSVSNSRDDARDEIAAMQTDQEAAAKDHEAKRVALVGQVDDCKDKVDSLTGDVSERNTKITKFEADVAACRDAVGKMENQQAEAKKKLDEFNAVTQQFQKMIDTGALEVEVRNGRMVVKLPAAVLFGSGRAELSKAGLEAINQVAGILGKMPGRRFIVTGHTDTLPTTGTQFKSNWELSAARAVTVTEALIAQGVKPESLTAAGQGPHAPVASNKTERGRLLNRRIEIVLEPDLDVAPVKPKKGK